MQITQLAITAWDGESLITIGALKQLSCDHGELNQCTRLQLCEERARQTLCWSTSSPLRDRAEYRA
jgi:hypothetical protein